MEEQNLEEWFAAQQEGCWDLAEPKTGHKERFSAKLGQKTEEKKTINLEFWWKPLAVAASVLFIVLLSLSQKTGTNGKELATVSPQMEETQDFFSAAIANELFEIKERRTPANKKLIDDALHQLSILETDYTKLKKDLTKSGEDKRVIYAMITNFQNRIDLL
ncbi:MAG TPA: hypothetical protein ENH91_15655, partial [Leeuwenhoekiella sp.]|nr:hypothetical protein [Leeuwenhoekiella sp.]